MKARVGFVPLIVLAAAAQPARVDQRTTGTCSPAVADTKGDVTITCYGTDQAQRKALQRLPALLEQILSKQTDGERLINEFINFNVNARREFRTRASTILAWRTARFLDVLSTLIVLGSDGWLPQSEQEFFSPRVAKLVCSEVNVDQASSLINQPIIDWVATAAKEYQEALGGALKEFGSQLDPEMYRAISDLESDPMFFV